MREIKYAEEKWILHRNAEPHRVNFESFFLIICLVFWFFKKEENKEQN